MASAYHRENLRGQLLELATQTLREQDVDALSLRDLARRAGVSHAAPARHFRDRAALLEALAVDGFARLDARLRERAAAHATFADRLAGLADAYLRFALDEPALLGLMFDLKHTAGATPELAEVGRACLATVVEVIAAAQQVGDAVDGDPERLALVAIATVHGVAALAAVGMLGDDTPAEVTQDAVDLLVSALTVR